MHGRRSLVLSALLLAAGCTDEPVAETPPTAPAPAVGGTFDRATTGTIEGRVTWQGPMPTVPDLLVMPDPENPDPAGKRLYWTPNPFRPRIDAETNGMRDVVVFLRTADAKCAGPWPHGRTRVVQVDRSLFVEQDGMRGRVGIVRRGDLVEAVNRDPEYHALRLRGAAFGSLPFVERDRITTKRLDTAGIVELTSGAGYFWMCAHLFVTEHPCCARTDATGRFQITHVPAGQHELVAWMPSWVVRQKYRDPESALTSRIVFAPPVEQVRAVEVRTGQTSMLDFTWHGLPDARTPVKH